MVRSACRLCLVFRRDSVSGGGDPKRHSLSGHHTHAHRSHTRIYTRLTHTHSTRAHHKNKTSSWELKKLHPGGLSHDWMDKMHDQLFFSDHVQHTHEHYLQVGVTASRLAFIVHARSLLRISSQHLPISGPPSLHPPSLQPHHPPPQTPPQLPPHPDRHHHHRAALPHQGVTI